MLETCLQYTVTICARRVLGKMKLLILCAMFHGLLAEGPGQVLSIGRWKEQVVAPEFLLDDREDITSNRNAFFYEDKRSFRPEGLGEQVKRIAGAEDVGLQPRLVTRSLQCTCETQYEIRDLGEGHYPRYLTASHCKPKACQSKFNPCRLLHYMVHILSQRDLNGLNDDHYSDDSALPETPLPEALRHKWQLKPMKIPVACVPATG
ncbi:prothoracicotropic hormone [Cataglyphis hispanica]|uniref:prothoracicotropic hormone n=1 Tax=Cataglyphis hispanica TaxID=1086592 RepID=UPI00217FCB0B|nr:prothoracicotropic hormone [Cataglyphis hispanica]